MTLAALLLAAVLPACASSIKTQAPLPVELPRPAILPQTTNLMSAVQAAGPVPQAIGPHEILLADFAANFTPGQAWTPQAVITEKNQALASLLQQKAESINAQMAAERQQMQSLIAGMSHDWKNGLNVVSLASQMLEGAPTHKNMLKRAISGMNDQALNFLNLAQLQSGKMAISPRSLTAAPVIEDAVEHQRLLAEKHKNVLAAKVSPDVAGLHADPGPLSIVLNNLVSNAAKYTKNGVITVGVEPGPAGTAEVYVQDTGIGMSKEDMEKIANGGFHRTAEGKKMAQGFGYGLPLVIRMLDEMGTRLEVRSEPGKGSRFSFLLPTTGPTSLLP